LPNTVELQNVLIGSIQRTNDRCRGRATIIGTVGGINFPPTAEVTASAALK
jgi:hypothetical protein